MAEQPPTGSPCDLPFVVGVLADLSGPDAARPPLSGRGFVDVEPGAIDDLLARLGPKLGFFVDDSLGGRGELAVELEFRRLADFSPSRVIERVAPLRALLERRAELADSGGGAPQDAPEAGPGDDRGVGDAADGGSLLDAMITSRDPTGALPSGVAEIDASISRQLGAILRHPAFRSLESTWRGLDYLLRHGSGPRVRIRVLDVSRRELLRDLVDAGDVARSRVHAEVGAALGGFGNEPFSVIVADLELGNRPEDMDLLGSLVALGADNFVPVLATASPQLLGLERADDLVSVPAPEKILRSPEHARWRTLRDDETSRFAALVVPRVVGRLPHRAGQERGGGYAFDEDDASRRRSALERLPWIHPGFILAAAICRAFKRTGWCVDFLGDSGGIDGLDVDLFDDDAPRCPAAVILRAERAAALADLGLTALVAGDGRGATAGLVVDRAPTIHRPKPYHDATATEDARIASQLPFTLALCRCAHTALCVLRRGAAADARVSREALETAFSRLTRATAGGGGNASAPPLLEGRVSWKSGPGAGAAVLSLRPRIPGGAISRPVALEFPLG